MDIRVQINTLNQIDQQLNLNCQNQLFLEQNHLMYKQLREQIYLLLTILKKRKNDKILKVGFMKFVIFSFIFFVLSVYIRISPFLLGILISCAEVFSLAAKGDRVIQYIQYHFELINKQIQQISHRLDLLKMKEIYYKLYRAKYYNRIQELQQVIAQ
ncbi:unnamed protein product [Paramecium octaurelia]|uniref:Transmembrane protein n=1 Tax=Paramecium octaurelia TaxID=43137 RepID=A0A8S1VB55_PAROT|nr:unnamed protein product [Paramecium octaurelia]